MEISEKDMKLITGIPHYTDETGEYYVPDKESPEFKAYKAGLDKQIEEWLKGNSIHNTWTPNEDHQECCPDFSCCGGKLWPLAVRQKFVEVDEDIRTKMCMMSISGLVAEIQEQSNQHVKVHVAGFHQS